MFKKIKSFFKRDGNINNEHGNMLIIVLSVVVLLSFSVSTITGMSVNLANNTTNNLTNINEENEAKAKIRLAVSDFEIFIEANSGNFTLYDNLYVENPSNTYGVNVTNETDNIEGLDNADLSSAAYKFSFTLSDGRVISLYVHIRY